MSPVARMIATDVLKLTHKAINSEVCFHLGLRIALSRVLMRNPHPTVNVWHDDSTSRGERAQYKCGLVADSTCRILLDLGSRYSSQVNYFPRKHHFLGEYGGFLRGHSDKKDTHQKGRQLIIRDFLIRVRNPPGNEFRPP